MPKYIDADRAIAFLTKTKNEFSENENVFRECVIDVLEMLPASNAIEVIRCSECKYYSESSSCGYCDVLLTARVVVRANDYCSYGERDGANND